MNFKEFLNEQIIKEASEPVLELLKKTLTRSRFCNKYGTMLTPQTLVVHYEEEDSYYEHVAPKIRIDYNSKDHSAAVSFSVTTWDRENNNANVHLTLKEAVDYIEKIDTSGKGHVMDKVNAEECLEEALRQLKKVFDPKKNMGLTIVKNPSDKFNIASVKDFEKYI